MSIVAPTARLKKEITLPALYALSTGATLSSGLFLLPGLAAGQVGPALPLCYLLAALPLIPAMFSIVELATAMPRAGGAYYFLDRSLGPLAGTVGGLGTWLALVLKTSFALVGMGAYLALFAPDPPGWLRGLIAVSFALVFGVVNWMGAKKSGVAQIVMVASLLVVLVIFLARSSVAVDLTRLEGFFGTEAETIFGTAGLVCISYVGLTKVASLSEEVDNPERNLPIAIFVSLGSALVIYLLSTFILVTVMPMDELSNSLTPIADAARVVSGSWGKWIIAVAALVAFASVANAGIMSASRYPLAMARDGLVPDVFKRLDRRDVPVMAIVVTVAMIVALILLLDPLKIAKLASAFQLLMFALICLAVIVMRESGLDSYDPGYRSPFYPWMQIVGIVLPILVIDAMGWMPILFSTGIVVVAVGWFHVYARSRVTRQGAVYHVFERLGRRRFDALDVELRSILKEKGLRAKDPFDEIVTRSIVLDSDASSFADVVREAADELATRVPDSAAHLYEGFMEGTRTGATPVTHGVALPHLRVAGIERPELVLARSTAGIEVPVDDSGTAHPSGPTYAIFFLVSPESDPGQHLRLLAQLASRVDSTDFLTSWRMAADRNALRRLFLQPDQVLTLTVLNDHRTSTFIGRALREVELPEGCLVAVVQRDLESLVPSGSTVFELGDRITLLGSVDALRTLYEQYEAE